MPTFIKPGFWRELCNPCDGYEGWLNLTDLINEGAAGTAGTSGTSGARGEQGIQGVQGVQGIQGSQGPQGIGGSSGTAGTSGANGVAGDRYQTTSSTSFTLGTGGTITIGTGLAYTTAQDILIAYDINNHQVSMVTSYNPATGALVFSAPSEITGSGTYNLWNVNLNGAAGGDGTSGTSGFTGTSGSNGAQGIQGIQGIQGVQGEQGAQGLTGTSGTSGTSSTLPTSLNYGLFAQTASSTPITGTIVETSLITSGVGTLTVPANTFNVGDSFHAKLIGHISCVGSAILEIRIKSGSILLADTGSIALDTSTNKHWEIDVYFTVRSLGAATVASIVSGGLFSYIKNSGTNFEGTDFSIINNTTFDTTISNTLDITAQWNSTNAGNSIYSEIFTLNKTY